MGGPIPGKIDLGIAAAVSILQANGIETFESCEGGEGHAFPEPTVRFHGRHSRFKAFTVAMEYGLPVLALRLSYSEHDRALEGPHWEIVFREKVPERTIRHTLKSESDKAALPSWCLAFIGALQHFDREAFHACRRV